jgi:hypothetical protein
MAGKLGLGYTSLPATFTSQLQLNTSTDNRQISLNGGVSNQFQFAGFGYNGSALKYFVPSATSSHTFYAGTNTTSSRELFKINGNGTIIAGSGATATTFDLNGNVNPYFRLRNTGLTNSNNISIGVSSIVGGFSSYANIGDVVFRTSGSVNDNSSMLFHNAIVTKIKFAVRSNLGMTLNELGQLSIGATSITAGVHTDYKLAVDGKIVTKSLYVTSQNWADYVFADKYELKSLETVEQFIEENNHLPNIPSATEIAEIGIDVADMQRLQMEKIEELTLYLIEQNKKIAQLETKIQELSK